MKTILFAILSTVSVLSFSGCESDEVVTTTTTEETRVHSPVVGGTTSTTTRVIED